MLVRESLAFGKPLLLSENRGMSDITIDGRNGYITKICAAMKTVMILSKEEVDRM